MICMYSYYIVDILIASGVRVPGGAGNFSLHHRMQTDPGTHPASYPVGNSDSFPRGKAVGA
jgi:hypothetical protein